MSLHAALGRRDAIQRVYRLLEARLTEIDAEPEPETAELRDELLQPATPR